MTLYNELKKTMISAICVDITSENAYELHRDSFILGVQNGLSNQESYWLADDITNTVINKTEKERREILEGFNEKEPEKISWEIGNGNYRMVPSDEGMKYIFNKLNKYVRGGYFKIYNTVDVCRGNYDCVNIEIKYDDSQKEDIENFHEREDYESKLIELFIKNRLGLEIDDIDFFSHWTIDEHWGETTWETWFIIGSSYTYKFK